LQWKPRLEVIGCKPRPPELRDLIYLLAICFDDHFFGIWKERWRRVEEEIEGGLGPKGLAIVVDDCCCVIRSRRVIGTFSAYQVTITEKKSSPLNPFEPLRT